MPKEGNSMNTVTELQEPRWVSACEIAVEDQVLQDIKFHLEFMMVMRACGRLEAANKSSEQAYRLVCNALGVEVK